MDTSQLQIVKASLLLVTILSLFVAERIHPAAIIGWNLPRWLKNFSLAAMNLLITPLVVLPVSYFAEANRFNTHITGNFLVLDLILLDCWLYVWHRLNHKLPWLWRFHEVHHLDEALDSSSGLRFHFGEVALSAIARALVIWLLNIPFKTVLLFETIVVVAALFQHSNLRLPKRFEEILSKLFVTPSLHWVHHHAKREDTDSNYATVLSLWDLVFRSRSKTKRNLSMKIGVEGKSDQSFLRLILSPFWRP